MERYMRKAYEAGMTSHSSRSKRNSHPIMPAAKNMIDAAKAAYTSRRRIGCLVVSPSDSTRDQKAPDPKMQDNTCSMPFHIGGSTTEATIRHVPTEMKAYI